MKTVHHNFDLTWRNVFPYMWADAWGKLEPPVAPFWARMVYGCLLLLILVGFVV